MEWEWSAIGVGVECKWCGSGVQSDWEWSVNGVEVECIRSGGGV